MSKILRTVSSNGPAIVDLQKLPFKTAMRHLVGAVRAVAIEAGGAALLYAHGRCGIYEA